MSLTCIHYLYYCMIVSFILGLWGKELPEGGDHFAEKHLNLFPCLVTCGSFVPKLRVHLVVPLSVPVCGKVCDYIIVLLWLFHECFDSRLTGKYTKIVSISLPVSCSVNYYHYTIHISVHVVTF